MLLDPVYQHVSKLVGAPADQLKVISCLLIAFPLGSLYIRIPANRPNISHWFSLVVSATFLVGVLGEPWSLVHLFTSCVGTYGIVLASRSPNMPWIAFFWVMGHLMYNHLRRLLGYVPDGAFDVTFSQMVLAQKLTSFAWNVHDGRQKLENLDSSQQALRLQHIPSPLAYLGYCFFFPSMLIGPSLDYVTYDSLVLKTIYNITPPGQDDSQAKLKRRIPHGRKRVAYLHLVIGLGFLGVYAVYGGRAAYQRVLTPAWFTWSILSKIGFIQLAGIVARIKYYSVWSLAEGACILTGAGFNGYDPKTGRTLWNRLRNVNIPAIETAESFKVLFDSWNCRTNVWLRDCMYKRLVKKGRKPGSKESMATFFTSAVWHGLEPGYYLAFITGGIYVSLGRQFRRFVRPFVLPAPTDSPGHSPNSMPKYPYPNLAKRIYDVLGWAMVQMNLNYTATAFLILGLKDSLRAWNRMWWHGHLMIIAGSLFFHFGGRKALQKQLPPVEKKQVPSINVAPPSPIDGPPSSVNTMSISGIKHKVIGLVSGGKDSTFNLLHCLANGHEIVALATLTPEAGIDELDSHLYQSVGTRVLPLIAQSMNLPLFTRDIKGKAVSRGPEYGSRYSSGEGSEVTGDETEDLYMLIKKIKEVHPDVTALASGAILSNYQRLRIEHVCQRLGLVSISYLWQASQLPLLEKMLACGMEVILVKVAGVGLGIDLVGKNLREIMPLLRRLESRYGSHPAGEGGEYETLTLSTPLFSHRLELENTEIIVTDPEPYPVAYLRVAGGKLIEKEGWIRPGVGELKEMLGLGGDEGVEGLDEPGRELLAELRQSIQVRVDEKAEVVQEGSSLSVDLDEEVRFSQKDKWFAASITGVMRGDESIGEELARCFDSIQSTLASHDLSLPLHTSHITLLLPSMSLFAPANAVYSTYFGTSPPSRATVAVPLPQGTRIRLEVVGYDDRLSPGLHSDAVRVDRQALHVQGLSYWAPANIGPYSQAVIVNSRVALAGQIPLIPSSLTLPSADYAHQSILALQHVGRIRDVLRSKASTGGGWTGWLESCTAWYVGDGLLIVQEAWKLWSEREECPDAPVVFVKAEELPKGALVEFQVNFHTGRPVDEEVDEDDLEGEFSSGSAQGMSWETCSASVKGQGGRAMVHLHNLDSFDVADLKVVCSDAISVKAYHTRSTDLKDISRLTTLLGLGDSCITPIPVHGISSRHRAAHIALEIFK